MGVFEFIGIIVFLYYLINIILWIVLDSDIELWLKERWGKSIGECMIMHLSNKEEQNWIIIICTIIRYVERKSCLDNGFFEWHW